jgi:hypothetical protein
MRGGGQLRLATCAAGRPVGKPLLVALAAVLLAAGPAQAADAAKQSAPPNAIERAAEKTGAALKRAGEKTGEALDKAAQKTGAAVDKAATKTGEAAEKAARKTESALQTAWRKTGAALRRAGRAMRSWFTGEGN